MGILIVRVIGAMFLASGFVSMAFGLLLLVGRMTFR